MGGQREDLRLRVVVVGVRVPCVSSGASERRILHALQLADVVGAGARGLCGARVLQYWPRELLIGGGKRFLLLTPVRPRQCFD